MTRAVARVCDGLLDAALVAFAAWTAIYHVCLVAGVRSGWAAGAWGVVLGAGALVGAAARLRRRRDRAAARGAAPGGGAPAGGGEDAGAVAAGPDGAQERGRLHPTWHALALIGAALGVASAAAFALAGAPYEAVWAGWLAGSACVLAWAVLRARAAGGPTAWGARARAAARLAAGRGGWLEPAVVVAWAVGLAVLSLFLLDPDADDAFYVHQSAWIAAHGIFPTRDVVFSNQVFPALYYPPVFSYEALVGTLSRITGLAVPDLQYLAIPPLASALSVLAVWRLLRTWRVPMAALALTATLTFLLFDAAHHMTLGSFFVSREWQGKVVLLTIGVPVLFALLHRYGERPSAARLALLLAAGVAAVGLSTTAIFLVPVIAGGCMMGSGLRSRRAALHAVAGFAAAAAYPVAAGLVTKLGGGRTPDVYTVADVVPANLVHYVIGTGGLALLGLAAALAGPVALRRPAAAAMVAGVVLVVGGLLSPGVPAFVFRHTGLGRVLWRLTWAVPVAALVGALATGAVSRGPLAVRALPALALCAALALLGAPVWSSADGGTLAGQPVLKRHANEIAVTRAILGFAHPGDLILAPRTVSQSLLIFSGRVTTVSPRGFFVTALSDVPAMHVAQRRALARFARFGLPPRGPSPRRRRQIRSDLRAVGVDLVCLRHGHRSSRTLLTRLRFGPPLRAHGVICRRAPAY